MKTIRLGSTQQDVSAVALGIMRMVRLDVDQATNVLETVHQDGINYIDSADIYGNGDSERESTVMVILNESLVRR